MEKNPGTVVGGSIVKPPSDKPKLSDLGISKRAALKCRTEPLKSSSGPARC